MPGNKTPDLFGNKPSRSRGPRRVMAHVFDAGCDAIQFKCKCGWDSGWLVNDMTVTEAKRGIPCPICSPTNKQERP